jgi:2-iminobutanoate/2-iminopropanoate deaminase
MIPCRRPAPPPRDAAATRHEETRMKRFFDPSDIAPPAGRYSQGVEITRPETVVHVAGQVGTRPDGTISGDFEEQAEQAFRNVVGVLRGAGLDVSDLVSIRTYILDRENLQKFRDARDRVLGTAKPASTLLVVAGLARPHWQIEIDGVAYR